MDLDERYGGFTEMFINKTTGRLNLNTMIYYREIHKSSITVLDIGQPVNEGAKITFW
jgi:hypothetical protein